MKKTTTSKDAHYESEAFNSGWLAGFDALVVDLYEGFNGGLPEWLLSVIGGKKAVVQALRAVKARERSECGDEIIEETDPDYQYGESEGYQELLDEVQETFKERKFEMPTFLQKIVEDGN
jgi:hypothetical protein